MLLHAMAKSELLDFPSVAGLPITSWFSARGSVVVRDMTTEVFVGGTLIGAFEQDEQLKRNGILVQLSAGPRCHLGRLAEAFGLSTERLRQLRREYEAGGLEALQRSNPARTVAPAASASATWCG